MLKEKIMKFTIIAYLTLNMILVATTLLYNFKFEYKSLEVFLVICYIAISCMSIYSYLRIKEGKNFLWLVTMIFALFLPANLFFMIPMITLTLVAISSKFKTYTHLLLPFILIILVVKSSLGYYVQSMDLRTEYMRHTNKDNTYALVTYMVDTGALGVDFPVYLEWDFFNAIKIEKRIALLQGNNEVFWIDNNTYSIDGEITDI